MKVLNEHYDSMLGLLFLIWWMAGVVYAVGYLKLLAVIFPPYSMYLVIEKIMIVNGLV